MKELRAHLWDVFVYGGIGAVALILWLTHEIFVFPERFATIVKGLNGAPTPVLVGGIPVGIMLLGALFEPLANYYEKFILAIPRLGSMFRPAEQSIGKLEQFIKDEFTDRIVGSETSPYGLCKEFVETKGLSTTFMPFLAKFGFYRSVSFLFFICFLWAIIGYVLGFFSIMASGAGACICLLLAGVYLKRSQQFYSFQKPSVYAAFLVPRLVDALGLKEQASDKTGAH